MERLTFMSGDEYPAVSSFDCYEDQNEDYCGPAIDRLAAYEDTGLTPEEVVQALQELAAIRQKVRLVPVIQMNPEV